MPIDMEMWSVNAEKRIFGHNTHTELGVSLNVVLFFSSRRRHTRSLCDWSSDVCSSDLTQTGKFPRPARTPVSALAGGACTSMVEFGSSDLAGPGGPCRGRPLLLVGAIEPGDRKSVV